MYADNPKCVSGSPAAVLFAAGFTSMYVRFVGQEAAPRRFVFFLVHLIRLGKKKCWAVFDAGEKWSVGLDVRDLGRHLDSTFSARAATLGHRISAAVPRVHSVAVLPLDFCGFFAFYERCICLLRSIILKPLLSLFLVCVGLGLLLVRLLFLVVCVCPGAVLSLLDGLVGSDPGFHVVWCRFRMLRRHMAYNSSVHELARIR